MSLDESDVRDMALDEVSIHLDSMLDNVHDELFGPSLDSDTETIDSMTVVSRREKIRACIVTIFPPNQDPKWLYPQTYFTDTSFIRNWCSQFERGGHTDKLHVHIWLECENKTPQRFSNLCKTFRQIVGTHPNIQKPKHRLSAKSRACAVNYCLKPDTRVPGQSSSFIWPHNKDTLSFNEALYASKPNDDTKKEDVVEQQRLHIESKPKHWSWDQILHETELSKQLLCVCSWGKKYHEGRHAETTRRTIKNVVIMYGAGGTGKTTLAHSWDIMDGEDKVERYYRRNPDDGHFWGGGRTAYKGQRIIHLEEFCGQEQLSRFKEICDIGKEGPPINIKQGGIMLNHDTVIITSNHHPAAWYRKAWEMDPKQFHPFWRRVTQVWFFPAHRSDGSDNIPSEECPPHYIDQTDCWKQLNGDYEACQNMASEFWPLKELGEGSTSPNFWDPNH
jgi:hypothetical protein